MDSQKEMKCAECGTTKSSIWEISENDQTLCTVCGNLNAASTSHGVRRPPVLVPVRKSRRVAATKQKGDGSKTNPVSTKTKSKTGTPSKSVSKSVPYKGPLPFAVPVLNPLLYKGVFFQHGDIISITPDHKMLCFAQIQGLFEDQYGEKYAVITWLLPTTDSRKGYFDPDTYIFGPKECLPRKLDGMKFVCHAPSKHYLIRDEAGYPVPPLRAEFGVLYKSTGPEIRQLIPDESFYNPRDRRYITQGEGWRNLKIPMPEPKRGRRGSRRR